MQARTIAGTFRNPNESLTGEPRRSLERDDILALTGTLTEDEWHRAVGYWLIDGMSLGEIADRLKLSRVFE